MSYLPMLRAQHSLNQLATKDPNYLDRGLPFYRKAWEEAAEMLVHLGDYWWKAQTVDLGQVRLELVDIWHFILSVALNEHPEDFEAAADVIDNCIVGSVMPDYDIEIRDDNGFRYMFIAGIEGFISDLITFENTSRGNPELRDDNLRQVFRSFLYLVHGAGWTMADVRDAYTIKFTLNIFRQHNGYREGTYIKLWKDGHEDNYFVTQIYSGIKAPEDWVDHIDLLYSQIAMTYHQLAREQVGGLDPDKQISDLRAVRAMLRG